MMFGRQDDEQPAVNQDATAPSTDTPAQSAAPTNTNEWQHPGLPVDNATTSSPVATVSPSLPAPASDGVQTHEAAASGDLIDIKQRALEQLSPLVSHLDQSPEEKFRTTMMMIQASDDQSLIQSAYDAAQAITDEKERAQALLDIINEINYFTQQKDA